MKLPTLANQPTRNLDRVSDGQLACIEGFVTEGWSVQRAAAILKIPPAAIRSWLRNPVFISATNEMVRAYCSAQLVTLGLARMRQQMVSPEARPADVIRATRTAAEIGGLYTHGSREEAGAYAAPRSTEMADLSGASAEDLARLARDGMRALEALRERDKPGS